MNDSLHVLLVEDDENDATLIERQLRSSGLTAVTQRVDTDSALRDALSSAWDVVLLDMNVPGMTTAVTLETLRSCDPLLPVLIVSGSVGEESAVDAIKAGARDYVGKDNLQRLVPALQRARREAETQRSSAKIEARFRATFEQTAVGIVHATIDGRIQRVNNTFAKMLGYSSADLADRTIRELTWPGDPVMDGPRLATSMGEEHSVSLEKRFRTAAGGCVWTIATLSLAASGPEQYVIAVVQDITERKETEEKLRQSEQRYRDLMEQAADGIFISDSDLRIVEVNRSASELAMMPAEQLIGRNALHLLKDGDLLRPRFEELAAGKVVRREGLVRRPDGSEVPVEISSRRLNNGLVQSIVRDVSERSVAEELIYRSEERFRLVALATNDAIFDIDMSEGTVWMNDRLAALLGDIPSSAAEMMQWWIDHIHPDDHDAVVERNFDGFAGEGHLPPREYRMVREDGGVVPVLERTFVVRDTNGRSVRAIGSITDLTSAKAAEAALWKSETRFQRLFETGTVGISFWRWDGAVVDANDTYLSMIGYTRDDLDGGRINWKAISVNRPEAAMTSTADEVRARGTSAPFQKLYRRRDGSMVPVLVTAVSFAGENYDGFSVVLDMTLEQAAVNRLRQSEERLRALIENSHDIIAIVSVDGTVVYESPSVQRILGYGPDELIGRNTFDFIHPEDRERVQGVFESALSTGATSASAEYRYRARDGSWRWLESVGRNLTHVEGINGVVVNSRDITERRVFQKQLEQAERLSSLGRLAATIAHEFNNVLMGIQPFAEVLRRRLPDDDRVTSACTHIESSVKRGRRITQEILRFTHAAEPTIANVSVGEWLQEAAVELRGITPSRQQLVIVPPKPGTAVAADRGQLTQALTNLVINARDAMPNGGRITIAVDGVVPGAVIGAAELLDPHAYVLISVSDEGSGMPAGVQHQIFEPLFTTKKGGTGLGLAVVHQIITRHHGHVFVESEEGRGTTFYLLIPRAKSADAVEAPDAPETPARRHARVLLIEDDHAVADGIESVLEMEGHSVKAVYRGRDAELAIREFQPTVVILDVGLPDISGLDLYRELAVAHATLPFIFSTGHGDAAKLGQIALNDRTRFLQKPYSSNHLLSLIDDVLAAND